MYSIQSPSAGNQTAAGGQDNMINIDLILSQLTSKATSVDFPFDYNHKSCEPGVSICCL